MKEMLFQPLKIGNILLKNRIIRSATYEGMSDSQGKPTDEYFDMYRKLADKNIGAIVTGFAYIKRDGRSMHPNQSGIDNDLSVDIYRRVTERVHLNGGKIFMQIAHCGRQTIAEAVGGVIQGASRKKSAYFGSAPQPLTTEETFSLAQCFADAALRCKKGGFDGVQIHAAHGYLVHQFILPSINDRKDVFGVDKKTRIGTRFLREIIDNIRKKCGRDFPLLIKISAGDDYFNRFSTHQFINLIHFLDEMKVDAIEISYGTMDHAFSIIRGRSVPLELILKYNHKFKNYGPFVHFLQKRILYPFLKSQIRMFTPMYNLPYAKMAKEHTQIPIICVGGFRTKQQMSSAIEQKETDFISLSRPFICEPDLVTKLIANDDYQSKCLDCNMCSVMCDSPNSTRCYFGRTALALGEIS